MNNQNINRVLGGSESQIVVGAVLYTVQNNLRGFALTVRTHGTTIAAIQVQDENGVARAYAPTWLGVGLLAGDYLVSLFPIVSITLTNATDSVVLHCDRPY
jgi:hypothetical protein